MGCGRCKARPSPSIGVNSAALPTALFASALMEKPFTPMNYRLSDTELARQVARTAPSVVIVDDDMAGRLPDIAGVTCITTSALNDRLPDERTSGRGAVSDRAGRRYSPLHQRHHRRAEGRLAASPAPCRLRHQRGGLRPPRRRTKRRWSACRPTISPASRRS